MNKLLYIFLIGFLLAASCNPDDNQVTEPHTTFRCKINGKDWEPAGGGAQTINPYEILYYDDNNSLDIVAFRSLSTVRQIIKINCFIKNIGVRNELRSSDEVFEDILNTNCRIYDLDTTKTNYILVSEIDTINYIIVGEFEFSAINNCNETVNITEGYFDLPYTF